MATKYSSLPAAGLSAALIAAFPGSAIVLDGEYIYFFSFTRFGENGQPRFLSRLHVAHLSPLPADLSGALETLVAADRWEPGFDSGRALLLMDDNASEMSVEYSEDLEHWVAIYGSPVQGDLTGAKRGQPRSDLVYLRYAEALEGPWSAPRAIYRIPELGAEDPGGLDSGTVCYAAKGHLAFSPPGEVLITYVCNLLTFEGEDPWQTLARLSRDMRLNRPRTVVLPLPAISGSQQSR